MSEFSAELMGDWLAPGEGYDRALRAMARADVDCENFDRSLPHIAGRHGDGVEVYLYYRGESSRFARKRHRLLSAELQGVPRLGIAEAERRVGRLSLRRCAELAGVELLPVRDAREQR